MRAALVTATGDVFNVVELPDDWTAGAAGAWAPPDGLTVKVLPADAHVAPGWTLTAGQWRSPNDQTLAAQADPVSALYAEIAALKDALAAALGATGSTTSDTPADTSSDTAAPTEGATP